MYRTQRANVVAAYLLGVLGELSIVAHGDELHGEVLAAASADNEAGRHARASGRRHLAGGSGLRERPLACGV